MVEKSKRNAGIKRPVSTVEIWKKVSHLNESRRAAEALWRGTNESWNLVLRRFRVAVDTWCVIKHWIPRDAYLCSVLYTFLLDDASADHERPCSSQYSIITNVLVHLSFLFALYDKMCEAKERVMNDSLLLFYIHGYCLLSVTHLRELLLLI